MGKYDTQRVYLAVVILFTNSEGRIAMLFRKNTRWMNDCFSLPGGKVEKNESVWVAAVREAEEEMGVTPTGIRHVATIYDKADDEEDDMKWVHLVFHAETWSGELHNAEPALHSELQWFNPGDLPDSVMPLMRVCVEAWLNKKGYVEHE